jgi:hypothetical protein
MNKNKYRGSNFTDFLKEEGIFEEVELRALKRALVIEMERTMKKQSLTKLRLASRMHTSRAALDRVLDPNNTSITLTTLEKVAHALGRKLKIDLLPA